MLPRVVAEDAVRVQGEPFLSPPGAHKRPLPISRERRRQSSVSGRRMNIHVRVTGRPNQCYALLCRDFLRAHATAAEAHALFKQRLAAQGMESGVYADI